MADQKDVLEQERRRVARCMQEKAENKTELAQALYRWNARMLSNQNCLVMPGDYMAVGNGCMHSSRGAAMDLDPDRIMALIESGALSHVFDMDDVNGPDFEANLGSVFGEIRAQRSCGDASGYLCDGGLARAVAVYDIPAAPDGAYPACFAAVERNGSGFANVTDSGTDFSGLRQCSYEEFNPGGKEIVLAAIEDSRPEQGAPRGKLFQEMKDQLDKDPAGAPRTPEEMAKRVPGYDAMSPREQMAVQVKLSDDYHKALERQASQEQGIDAGDQWGPGLPGRRGY